MRKKTVLNIAIIALVLSFFVTPLGDYSKLLLNRIFSFSPQILQEDNRNQIVNYDWKLKDANWEIFNFNRSKGRVVFINFWRSWVLPSEVELESIQKLYDAYSDRVDFYIITNEERAPVKEFMGKKGFTFPVTYSIMEESMPVDGSQPPQSYLLDKEGRIVINQVGIADWDNDKVKELLDKLLVE
ncbi:TlpA family protein disulfide reductase [Arenibacter latericius]|uniref:TlpA family protein disulfide reductase n=1 Tax=Arenibacter latericius TaxID=86104 RepID=UPI000403D65C|nr:TlpA disulfide reductase family protein [Arenibacter latericius]